MPGLTLENPPLELAPRFPGASPTPRRPLRVCYLIDELATAGTETQLLALIRRVDRRKVQPYLCLLRGDSPLSRALEPPGVATGRLGVRSLVSPSTPARAARFVRFLRRERIDAVQVYFPDSTYFGVPLAWLAGVPHRVRTRNNSGHATTPLHRRLGRLVNRLTTCTLANCGAAKESLLRDERPDPETVHVLENGVDLERFKCIPTFEAARENRPPRIGIVANLRRVKGLDVLIGAAASLAVRQHRFLIEIAGEGDERAALQRQIDVAGLTNRVLLRGACEDVPDFLSRLDIAVLCSRAEGLPNAVLEYMAAGRPIVATRVGAVPELVEDAAHGLLVPPEDPGALADALERMLTDRPFAASCAAAARARVADRYSRAAMIRRFEDFYDRLSRS
jgi:glycosyltransferase involved in cell wall biosynthesis